MNENNEAAITTPVVKPPSTSQQQRAEWVRRYLESGLSLREFSTQNGMGYMSLWRWVNKARKKAPPLEPPAACAFTEIKLAPSIAPLTWVAELSWADGKVLRLSQAVPPAMLEQLLGVC